MIFGKFEKAEMQTTSPADDESRWSLEGPNEAWNEALDEVFWVESFNFNVKLCRF